MFSGFGRKYNNAHLQPSVITLSFDPITMSLWLRLVVAAFFKLNPRYKNPNVRDILPNLTTSYRLTLLAYVFEISYIFFLGRNCIVLKRTLFCTLFYDWLYTFFALSVHFFAKKVWQHCQSHFSFKEGNRDLVILIGSNEMSRYVDEPLTNSATGNGRFGLNVQKHMSMCTS